MADLTPIIYIVLGALGSLVAWVVLGPIMTGLGFKRLVRKAAQGDPEAQRVFFEVGTIFVQWAGQPSIPTGKKIKVATEDGETSTDEILSPIEYIGRVVGNYTIAKFKGMVGGNSRAAGAELAQSDPGLASLLSLGAGPRKGQTMQEWAVEQLMVRAMPMIEQKMQEVISKAANNNQWGR